MDHRDPHEAVREAENALRELISSVLQRDLGPEWLDASGLSSERLALLPQRLAEEQKRRPQQKAESRLIYYADLPDLTTIIRKHWEKFKPFLGDRKEFDVFIDRLEDLRNPDAHHRGLWPYEIDLIYGISGTFRQAVASARTQLSQVDQFYQRFEQVIDNFGNSWTPNQFGFTILTTSVLRPGDHLTYRLSVWNPTQEQLELGVQINLARTVWTTDLGLIDVVLTDADIDRHVEVFVRLRSPRDREHGRSGATVCFTYIGLPE